MSQPESARAAAEPAARIEQELQLYYWMKLVRAFEERVSRLHRQNKVFGGVYSGAGQEAIIVGSVLSCAREILLPRFIETSESFWCVASIRAA